MLEYCSINLYAAQHQPVLLCLYLGYGEETGILSFPVIQGCPLPCGDSCVLPHPRNQIRWRGGGL